MPNEPRGRSATKLVIKMSGDDIRISSETAATLQRHHSRAFSEPVMSRFAVLIMLTTVVFVAALYWGQ
jgi:hypothetical protein